MQHLAIVQPQQPEPLIPMGGHSSHRRLSRSVPGGDWMRMVAAMVGPSRAAGPLNFENAASPGRSSPYSTGTAESDVQYYGRRSTEEGRAAVRAASPKARELHRELAARYARLSREAMRSRAQAPRHSQAAVRGRLTDLLGQRFGLGVTRRLSDRT
jgi:hypothetical protein